MKTLILPLTLLSIFSIQCSWLATGGLSGEYKCRVSGIVISSYDFHSDGTVIQKAGNPDSPAGVFETEHPYELKGDRVFVQGMAALKVIDDNTLKIVGAGPICNKD